MKQVTVSDEVFEQLKDFIVDPFDETIETVITRLITITCKARDRWLDLNSSASASGGPVEVEGELPLAADSGAPARPFQSRRISEPSVL